MPEPRDYIDTKYLNVLADLLKQDKQRTYTLMHLQPGQTVLDVGCGPGTDRPDAVPGAAISKRMPRRFPSRRAHVMRAAVSGSSNMYRTRRRCWRR